MNEEEGEEGPQSLWPRALSLAGLYPSARIGWSVSVGVPRGGG